jgi:hypothetical protein
MRFTDFMNHSLNSKKPLLASVDSGKFSISELSVIKTLLSQKETIFTDINEKIVKG